MTNEMFLSRRHFLAAFGSTFALAVPAEALKRRDGEILIAHCTDPHGDGRHGQHQG